MNSLALLAFEFCRTTLFINWLCFCPRIVNEYLLCLSRRLLPGVSIGILADDIKLHRPSDRGIGEVASVRFAQKAR